MELLIGCGSNREKKLTQDGNRTWTELVTLDFNEDHKPDVVWDLNKRPLPFEDNTFDECHAYDVLEHLSKQGDFAGFFAEWSEFWRILKPGGVFVGCSPHWSSPWVWMDPGHARAYGPEMMVFLVQTEYAKNIGVTPMSDYRFIYKADFDIVHSYMDSGRQYQFALKAVKPSRIGL